MDEDCTIKRRDEDLKKRKDQEIYKNSKEQISYRKYNEQEKNTLEATTKLSNQLHNQQKIED